MNRYFIGTSFFFGCDNFKRRVFEAWCDNTAAAAKESSRTVIIYEGGTIPPFYPLWADSVRLEGDLGHIHQHLDGGPKSHYDLTGWSASMLTLAMMAYVDCADFIYKESDCFAFGPWVEQMYRDCGDHGWVFGPKMKTAPYMACAQSLFLVKHAMIPRFVRQFLLHGPENHPTRIGETRFISMESVMQAGRLSFGVDRERPIPWDAPLFYFQQPTAAELAEAQRRNLI